MLATERTKYFENKNYKCYSESAFNRITTLSFQNKKGLSFGLELSDLFAWAKWNSKELQKKTESKAQEKRIKSKIKEVVSILKDHKVKASEVISIRKTSAVGGYRVSEFIKSLKEFKEKT